MSAVSINPKHQQAAESAMRQRATDRMNLTKAALQGLCAAAGDRWSDTSPERIARRAVHIADATLLALANVKEHTDERHR